MARGDARDGRWVLLAGVGEERRRALTAALERRGFGVRIAPAAALGTDEAEPTLAIAELHADAEAARWRARLAERPGTQLVVLAGSLSLATTLELVRAGVVDAVALPSPVADVVKRALAPLAGPDPQPQAAPSGSSAAVRALRRRVATVARTGCTVLLTGETGTGKGLVARSIHRASPRRRLPFVHVDCASLSATVIESELFGHERGAFTGAFARRQGRFEQAGEGTVFLDEVGELAPFLQSKLLRVLQDREYERLGGSRTLPMRARILAATSRDLRAGVATGRFRADLYYRLRVVELALPPLRARLDDLPELVEESAQRLARRLGCRVPAVAPDFCARLREQPWPGNVRELVNLIERLLVEHPGADLDASLLDDAPAQPAPGSAARPPLPPPTPGGEHDAVRIAAVLRATGGNVARAARRLGWARSTLRHRIARHGLETLIPRD